jgi:hypothetical protein
VAGGSPLEGRFNIKPIGIKRQERLLIINLVSAVGEIVGTKEFKL